MRDFRPALRALRRDAGFLAVGSTTVYAGSGLAVDHVADRDPSLRPATRIVELGLGTPLRDDDAAAARILGERLGVALPLACVAWNGGP